VVSIGGGSIVRIVAGFLKSDSVLLFLGVRGDRRPLGRKPFAVGMVMMHRIAYCRSGRSMSIGLINWKYNVRKIFRLCIIKTGLKYKPLRIRYSFPPEEY